MPEQLPSQDYYVDPDIRKARTLPSSAFTSNKFLDLELSTIFNCSWLLAPTITPTENSITDVSQRGAHIPFTLLRKPLFLQRDDKAKLQCFPNVCSHAWYPLVESAGTSKTLVCPQHGRQFSLNGKFLAQAGFKALPDFPQESDHLENLPVQEWNGIVFTSLGTPTIQFNELTREVNASIPGLSSWKMEKRVLDGEVRKVEGNWKQHAWNYMDNFHIRFIHKGPGGLADGVDLSSYTTELYQHTALQWVYARRPENGFEPGQLAERFRDPEDPERRVFALWWFLFPNTTLNFYPWGLSVNTYNPVPDQAQKTEFLWQHYVIDGAKFNRRNEVWLDEQVDREDLEAIGLVSRGARSGYAPRGRFAPHEETGPHWFHRLVYATIFQRERAPPS